MTDVADAAVRMIVLIDPDRHEAVAGLSVIDDEQLFGMLASYLGPPIVS